MSKVAVGVDPPRSIDGAVRPIGPALASWLRDRSYVVLLVVAIIHAMVLWFALGRGVILDFDKDVAAAIDLVRSGRVTLQSPFHVALAVLSGLALDPATVRTRIVVLAALAAVVKIVAFRLMAERSLPRTNMPGTSAAIVLAGAALTVVYSLPKRTTMFAGQLPPNVWHDASAIVVAPLVLLVCWRAVSCLSTLGPISTAWFAVATCAVTVVEPLAIVPFLVTYSLAVAATAFRRHAFRKTLGMVVPIVFPVLLLTVGFIVGDEVVTSLVLEPLAAWDGDPVGMAKGLAASLAFPLVAFSVRPRAFLEDVSWSFAAATTAVAVALSALLFDPNGALGTTLIACSSGWMFVLFMATMLVLLRHWFEVGVAGLRSWAALMIFVLHAAAGVMYLDAMLRAGTYAP